MWDGGLRLYQCVKRRMLRLLTCLALLLCGAACVLWVRSHVAADGAFVTRTRMTGGTITADDLYLISDSGGLLFRRTVSATTDPTCISTVVGRRPMGRAWGVEASRPGEAWGREPSIAGALSCYVYSLRQRAPGGTFRMYDVRVPYWAPALAALLPPGIPWLRRQRRLRSWKSRAAKGLCPSCGYDLTGNVSGVCPECGRGVP